MRGQWKARHRGSVPLAGFSLTARHYQAAADKYQRLLSGSRSVREPPHAGLRKLGRLESQRANPVTKANEAFDADERQEIRAPILLNRSKRLQSGCTRAEENGRPFASQAVATQSPS